MAEKLIIGLTGGIGSGKSTVCAYFTELGATVIDADQVAREIVAPGEPALQMIIDVFGPSFLTSDGTLDRALMREHIFGSMTSRQRLEQILHPLIRTRLRQRSETATGSYVILAIPLLIESGRWEIIDRILVVQAPTEQRIARICQRDHINAAQAQAILNAQCSDEVRLNAADDVIYNDNCLDVLHQQILELHQRYLLLTTQKGATA